MEREPRKWPLWVLQRYVDEKTNFDLPSIYMVDPLRIEGKIDIQKLERAINDTMQNNDLFKLHLETIGDELYIVEKPVEPYTLYFEDLSVEDGEEEEKEEQAMDILRRYSGHNMPPYNLPFGFLLIKLDEEDYLFAVLEDHTLSDGISSGFIINEIAAWYNGEDVPVKEFDFCDYLEELASSEYRESRKKMYDYCRDLQKGYEPFPSASQVEKASQGKMESNPILFLDTEQLEQVAEKLTATVFTISLFLYHAAIAVGFERNDTLTFFPMGERRMKYRQMAGLALDAVLNRQAFRDEATLLEHFAEFKTNYNSNLSLGRPGLNLEKLPSFCIASQNAFTNVSSVQFGEAEGEWFMWTDMSDSNLRMFMLMILQQPSTTGIVAVYNTAVYPEDGVTKFACAYEKCLEYLLHGDERVTFGELRQAVEETRKG